MFFKMKSMLILMRFLPNFNQIHLCVSPWNFFSFQTNYICCVRLHTLPHLLKFSFEFNIYFNHCESFYIISIGFSFYFRIIHGSSLNLHWKKRKTLSLNTCNKHEFIEKACNLDTIESFYCTNTLTLNSLHLFGIFPI